jgi:hypothetical protein
VRHRSRFREVGGDGFDQRRRRPEVIVEASLLSLWDRATEDPDAAAVFLDALLERPNDWRDERVMMLCLGVPLDVRPPDRLGEQGRRNWRAQRRESISFAQRQRDLYAHRSDFARATIATLIFGDWKTRGTSGGPPWPLARRADPAYQARLEWRRARAAGRRDRGVR